MMEGLFTIQESGAATVRVAMATAFTFAAVFLLVLGVSSYMRARGAVKRRAAATSFRRERVRGRPGTRRP